VNEQKFEESWNWNRLWEPLTVLKSLGFPGTIHVHNDPEFMGRTFGEGPRDWMLAKLHLGDYVFFVASMKKVQVPSKQHFIENPDDYKDQVSCVLKKRRGQDWFYGLFAQIRIREMYAGRKAIGRYGLGHEVRELDGSTSYKVSTNAHIISRDHPPQNCIIVIGEGNQSGLYNQAIQISHGNNCLPEFRDIFYRDAVVRHGAKWFEAVFDDAGTSSLLRFAAKGKNFSS
jgi:hypothetical protein